MGMVRWWEGFYDGHAPPAHPESIPGAAATCWDGTTQSFTHFSIDQTYVIDFVSLLFALRILEF